MAVLFRVAALLAGGALQGYGITNIASRAIAIVVELIDARVAKRTCEALVAVAADSAAAAVARADDRVD